MVHSIVEDIADYHDEDNQLDLQQLDLEELEEEEAEDELT